MVVATAGSPAVDPVPFEEWEPLPGAQFLVDTKETTGYLINLDGTFTTFPVVLGQNRVVHYLGRTYNATTPQKKWVVKEIDKQGDRITFGPNGTFMRLFDNGEEYTSYGIHSHAYIKYFLASDDQFRSMGCILVTDDVLETLVRAYKLNGKTLNVVTVYGVQDTKSIAETEKEIDPRDIESAIVGASSLVKRPASIKG